MYDHGNVYDDLGNGVMAHGVILYEINHMQ